MPGMCIERLNLGAHLRDKGYIVSKRTNAYTILLDRRGARIPVTVIFDWPMLIASRGGGNEVTAFTPPLGSNLLPDEGPVCIIDRNLNRVKGYGYASRIGDSGYYKVRIENGEVSRWDYVDFLLAAEIDPPVKTLLAGLGDLRPIIVILARLFTTISPSYIASLMALTTPSMIIAPCIDNKPLIKTSQAYACINFKGKPPQIAEDPRGVLENIPPAIVGF
ncbi:MAG: hypothetical protein GSR85_05205 [Desulfurococcales archaeon]|nr:hypothetical protein [Desulfurococcales archaeon]